MTADRDQRSRCQGQVGERDLDRLGETPPQLEVQPAELIRSRALHGRRESGAERLAVGNGPEADQGGLARALLLPRELRHGHIDAVQGCTGHHAGVEQAFSASARRGRPPTRPTG